jgi:serine/threonine protein kinase
MPPEQFTNAPSCDQRSDIYSFGIVLYQMASHGAVPFLSQRVDISSEQGKATFWREMYQLHKESTAPRVNSPLFPIIERCLMKNPNERWRSITDCRHIDTRSFHQVQGPSWTVVQLHGTVFLFVRRI